MEKTPIPELPVKLTEKQERFSQFYVDGDCENGTAAARGAGYHDPRQAAYACLRSKDVQQRIAELKLERQARIARVVTGQAERSEHVRYEVTRDAMIQRMAQLYMAPIAGTLTKDVIEAGRTLGKWMGMEEKKADPFAHKSKSELEFFIAHGYFPDAVDQSESRPN